MQIKHLSGSPARALLSPVGAGISALVSTVTLLIASRQGQFQELAAYAAGLSMGAVAGVVAGGGTTLSYLSGDLATRKAVREVRFKVVAPAMTSVALLSAVVFTGLGGMPALGVLFGGLTAVANNLSEIEVGYLRQRLRTPTLLAVELVARMLALALVAAQVSIAFSMALASGVRLATLYKAAISDPSREPLGLGVRVLLRKSYKVDLVGASLMYALLDRAPFIAAGFTLSSTTAGGYSTALSLQQSSAGVMLAGAQTTMAVRSDVGSAPRWMVKFEGLVIGVGALGVGLALAFQPELLSILNLSKLQFMDVMWAPIWLALPVALTNRSVQFRWISAGRAYTARQSLFVGCTVLLVALAVAVALSSPLLLAFSSLVAETAGLAAALVLRQRASRRHS